jgi:hemolysin activation/secretion protein
MRRLLWLALIAGSTTCLKPAHAQDVAEETRDGEPRGSTGHRISEITVVYVRENPGHPAPGELLEAEVEVAETPEGFAAPEAGQPTKRIRLRDIPAMPQARFTDTALALIAPAVVQRMRELGFVGVYVVPDTSQFRVEDGRVVDLRPPGDFGLRLEVTTGVVTEVRTVGLGERLDPEKDQTVNHPIHRRIRENSPIQPYAEGSTVRHDLLRRDLIDEYTMRLSRYPWRRVDVSVSAPGDQPGAVVLDYLVTENRPWLVFAQVSNTGSENTDAWREHFGFIHNDLTNVDDVLTLDYQTANFDDVHAFSASYERPFRFTDRLRWAVRGSWYRYVASDLGFADEDFRGEGWYAGGDVIWNFFQKRELFLDLVLAIRFEHVEVVNEIASVEGETELLIPTVALRVQRHLDQSRLDGQIGFDFNLADAAGTEDDLNPLGRLDADRSYAVLRGEVAHSFYLDPLLREDPEGATGLAHEVAWSVKGQHALGSRLIPNEMMAAGGLYTVRGYPYAVVAGDNAVIGSLEYRFHLPRALNPRVDPGKFGDKPFRWRPQYPFGPTDWDLALKAFLDAARVTNTDRLSFEADQTLVGAGVGADFSLTRRFRVRTDLGFTLKELEDAAGVNMVDAGHAEFHVVITLVY